MSSNIFFLNMNFCISGKVMVYCRQGVSRSTTIVLGYLMLKHKLKLQDALRQVREHREVCPNNGFLQQLCDYNDKLHAQGYFHQT